MTFAESLERKAKGLIERRLTAVHRAVCLEVLKRVVLRTPVDAGQLRGAWQTNVGSPAGALGPLVNLKTRTPLREGINKLTALGPFQIVYITNAMPYAETVEKGLYPKNVPNDPESNRKRRAGRTRPQRRNAKKQTGDEGAPIVSGGFSLKAPQGMLGVVLDEIRPALKPGFEFKP